MVLYVEVRWLVKRILFLYNNETSVDVLLLNNVVKV